MATINAVDFIYTCDGHLTDVGFCSPIANNPSTANDNVEAGKLEYEAQQRRKREKEKLQAEQKDKKDNGTDQDSKKDGEKDKERDKATKIDAPKLDKPSTEKTFTPAYAKFALHREIFSMRVAEHRKRRLASAAKVREIELV